MSVALILWPNTLNSMGGQCSFENSIICKRILGAGRVVVYGPPPNPNMYCNRARAMPLNIWEEFTGVVQLQCNLNIWEGRPSSTNCTGLCRNVLCAVYTDQSNVCTALHTAHCTVLYTAFYFAIFDRLQQLHVKSSRLEHN